MTTPWIRLEPKNENDGTRYAWDLVIEFDPDWQDFELISGAGLTFRLESGAGLTFRLEISDEMVDAIRQIKEAAT